MSQQNKAQNKKEIRLANISDFSIERREDENKMIIEGYAAVYDSETKIGCDDWGFYEKIERGAFDGADMKDVPLKYNHSDDFAIFARTRNKSLTLTPDDKGLRIHAELLDTTDGIDMYKRIKAGLIDKMSFAFTCKDDGYTMSKAEDGAVHRSITQFDRIFDVSVVDTPAYEDTSIYARSKELAEAWESKPLDSDSVQRSRDFTITNIIKQYRGNK